MVCQILIRLHPAHGHATHVLFLLIVIWLVAQGDLFLLNLSPELSIHSLARRGGRRHGVVLKDSAHVVEELGGRKEHIGTVVVIEMIQKELGVLISLSGPAEPHYCLDLIRLNTLPSQIQLSQHILGILVSRLR